MALKIPKKGLGQWAQELVSLCSASQKDRIQKGAFYRNLYLTGDSDGNPATYPKAVPYLENLASFLYSPVELRFAIEASEQPDETAMAKAAQQRLHSEIRGGSVDLEVDESVIWSLVKGKSFLQLLWAGGGFEANMMQPELFGVMREDLSSLDAQECFFHSVYLTKGQFASMVQGHPDAESMIRKAKSYLDPEKVKQPGDQSDLLKTVILGGLNPYQKAGSPQPRTQGVTDWLSGPRPTFDPKVLAELIRLDELWVRDAARGEDWTTLQVVGTDCIVEGKYVHRNLFADPVGVTDRELLEQSRKANPLTGHHPFIEFCANPLKGYFWGKSEINNIALLQIALNARMAGIQSLLRRQENPPRYFTGTSTINQNAYAKLNKPGGFLADGAPNAKMETLAPDLPDDLWMDLREIEQMFDDMGGFSAVMRGKGESGVRAQGHAETLVRTASPRFKTRALRIERSVEAVGGLALDILRAKLSDKLAGWAKPGPPLPNEAPAAWWSRFFTAPAPGMKRIEFMMYDLPAGCKVTVDSHSSSPAFSHESKELAFELNKVGAISPTDLLALAHPPHEESLILEAERREIEHAKFMAEHPELAAKEGKKKK
jgi:hypothetical protein